MLKTLLSRFASSSVLISEPHAALFEGHLSALAKSPDLPHLLSEKMVADDEEGFWIDGDSRYAAYRPYVVRNGILRIPVQGILLSDFPWQVAGWATGYQYISRAFRRGLADPDVRGIAFMVNSPGGEVAENFDLVEMILANRGKKPTRAFVYEYGYSGAYSISSAADRIDMSRTGGVGSIGVLLTHIDVSKALDQAGWKITFVSAPKGGHKTDGNSYEPLSDQVRARWQERADALYDMFVRIVARGRGISEDAIRETKALTFSADEAIERGLADQVSPLDDAVAAFAADLFRKEGTETMPQNKENAAAADAAIDAARAEGHAAGRAEGHAEGFKEGAAAERSRINAILSSDAGKARPKAALSAALKTDMSVEQAVAFLEDLPAEGAASDKPDGSAMTYRKFDAAMQVDRPDVGAFSDIKDEDDSMMLAESFGLPGIRRQNHS